MVQVGGGEAGLPLVAVEHLRIPGERAVGAAQQRGDARQQAEAQCVVAPVSARFILIGSARTVIEFGAVEQVQRYTRGRFPLEQSRCRQSCARREARELAAAGHLCEHPAVRRQQHARIDSESRKCDRQGRTDVAEAAGFHQRRAFRRGEQDAHWAGVRGGGRSGGRHGLGSPRLRQALLMRAMLAGLRRFRPTVLGMGAHVILAGDIGGTKALLMLAAVRKGRLAPLLERRYLPPTSPIFPPCSRAFWTNAAPRSRAQGALAGACFGAAGPAIERSHSNDQPALAPGWRGNRGAVRHRSRAAW